MYFPLLRAKQFELLALREIAPLISNKPISPIIEPTKDDVTQLLKAIHVLTKLNMNFTLILNSYIVNNGFMDNINKLINTNLKDYSNFQIGINVNQDFIFDNAIEFLEINNLQNHAITLIHLNKANNIDAMNTFINSYGVKYNVLHIENVKARYKRNFSSGSSVSLNDSFNQQQRNSDYMKFPDELFSEEVFFYSEEGFVGFSDYLTIGEAFSESGFTPYVVVIHLTYRRGSEIRIAHFGSKSNNDTNSALDLPKKFGEALGQLMQFVDSNAIKNTKAITEFRKLQLANHFPGLGSIKKLSIMNHLELVSTLI